MTEASLRNVGRIEGDTGFWARFRSRPRVLATWFYQSRELWKRKYQELKSEVKRLKVRVADVQQSRELWKKRVQERERELADMKAEVDRLQREIQQSEIKTPPVAPGALK